MNVQPIEFEVGGLILRGNIYEADKPRDLAVLFLHGWTGIPNEDAAKILAENGFTSMTFSLSGHNNSDGKIEDQTRQKSLQEALAFYDLFRKKLPADTKIGVAGSSYGGYLAPILSTEREIAFMSLRVPADYPDEAFNRPQMGQGSDDPVEAERRKQKQDFNTTKALRATHGYNGSIQIIEAELDEVVPHQCVQNYVDAIQDKSKLDYHLMKGWSHGLSENPEHNRQYQEILLNWLKTQV